MLKLYSLLTAIISTSWLDLIIQVRGLRTRSIPQFVSEAVIKWNILDLEVTRIEGRALAFVLTILQVIRSSTSICTLLQLLCKRYIRCYGLLAIIYHMSPLSLDRMIIFLLTFLLTYGSLHVSHATQ